MASRKYLFALLALPLSTVVASAEIETPDLSQLTGNWAMEENGRWTRETWNTPVDNALEGNAQSGVGNKRDFAETMRIAKDETGSVTLFVRHNGSKSETPFDLVSTAYQQLMFENLKNDYPQRIIYFRDGGWLFAKIMQADGRNEKNFVYRPANPLLATKTMPVPTAKQVEEAVTSSHMCHDPDGFTLCMPPLQTKIRNLVCWPMDDLKGYIAPYRTSPAAECSFEARELPIYGRVGREKVEIAWRASWARLHFIAIGDCAGEHCTREWYIPPI